MDKSNATSNYKETVLRQSFVFNTGGTNNLQRSFINTALINDSLAFGDDLRRYWFFKYLDPAFRIYQIIRKLTLVITFSL